MFLANSMSTATCRQRGFNLTHVLFSTKPLLSLTMQYGGNHLGLKIFVTSRAETILTFLVQLIVSEIIAINNIIVSFSQIINHVHVYITTGM